MKQKRKSTEVRLGLASVAAMVGGLGLMAWVASEQSKDNHPLYRSKEDCEREWTDHDCEPQDHQVGGYSRTYYRGPSVRGYNVDENGKARRTDVESDYVPAKSRAVGIQRGGFGSSGVRFGGGS
jgi:uncharacterized protein YgiB involved in biofilm formation